MLAGAISINNANMETIRIQEEIAEVGRLAGIEERKSRRQLLISKVTADRNAGQLGWLKGALEGIREAGAIEVADDVRNELLALLARFDMDFSEFGIEMKNSLAPIVFGPGHKITAIAVNDELIEIRSHPENKLLDKFRTKFPLKNCQLGFGGEGNRYLVVASSKEDDAEPQLMVYDWTERTIVVKPLPISNHAYDFLPKEKGLAIGRTDGSLDYVNWTGEVTDSFSDLGGRPTALSVRPDGKQLAVGLESQGLLIIDEASKDTLYKRPELSPVCLSWDPLGKFLVIGEKSGGVSIIEPERGKSLLQTEGHSTAIQQITWSDDSRLIATVSDNWDIRLWDRHHGSKLSSAEARVGDLSFSPDGLQLGPVVRKGKYFSLNIFSDSKVCHRATGHPGGEIVALGLGHP